MCKFLLSFPLCLAVCMNIRQIRHDRLKSTLLIKRFYTRIQKRPQVDFCAHCWVTHVWLERDEWMNRKCRCGVWGARLLRFWWLIISAWNWNYASTESLHMFAEKHVMGLQIRWCKQFPNLNITCCSPVHLTRSLADLTSCWEVLSSFSTRVCTNRPQVIF